MPLFTWVTSAYESPIVTYCKEHGLKLDRETYIAACYPEGVPEPWTAELEGELPPEFQLASIEPEQEKAASKGPVLFARSKPFRPEYLATDYIVKINGREVVIRPKRPFVGCRASSLSFQGSNRRIYYCLQSFQPHSKCGHQQRSSLCPLRRRSLSRMAVHRRVWTRSRPALAARKKCFGLRAQASGC